MSLCSSGCLGCSFCDEEPLSDSEKKEIERKETQKRIAEGKPTLHVKLGSFFFRVRNENPVL
jgi:hypothetical protein